MGWAVCKLARGSSAHRVRNLVAHLRGAFLPSSHRGDERRMRSHACSIKKDPNLAGQFVGQVASRGSASRSNFHPSPLFPLLDVSGRMWSGGGPAAPSHKRGSSFPRILWNSPPPGTGVDCVFGYSSSSSNISTSSGTLLIDYIRSYIEICTCSSDFGRFVFSYNLTKLNQGESLSSKRSCNFFISFFLLLLDHVIFYYGSSRWIF